MSLPADCMTYGFHDFDSMDHLDHASTAAQMKMKRPRSPTGMFDNSRCISEGELSGEEGSFCTRSSFSSLRSRSAEDFSSLLGEDDHSASSLTAFDSVYEDDFSRDDLIADNFVSFGHDSLSCAASGADEISAKRRKKLSALVPYPRIPRTAEYQCSNCSHNYSRIVADNPWWAVYRHDCPSCHTNQVPRIDINKEENAIELDPNVLALYGEGVEDSADEGDGDDEEECGEEGSETSFERDSEDLDVSGSVPTCYVAEGNLYPDKASKLLVLMCHAKSCRGVHSSPAQSQVCKTTKLLMLHLRDCKDLNCSHSSCASAKNLLQHISLCGAPSQCSVCSPKSLPETFLKLHKLNQTVTK